MYVAPNEAYSLNVLNSTKNKTPGHILKQQSTQLFLTYCCHCVSQSTCSGSSGVSLHVLKVQHNGTTIYSNKCGYIAQSDNNLACIHNMST